MAQSYHSALRWASLHCIKDTWSLDTIPYTLLIVPNKLIDVVCFDQEPNVTDLEAYKASLVPAPRPTDHMEVEYAKAQPCEEAHTASLDGDNLCTSPSQPLNTAGNANGAYDFNSDGNSEDLPPRKKTKKSGVTKAVEPKQKDKRKKWTVQEVWQNITNMICLCDTFFWCCCSQSHDPCLLFFYAGGQTVVPCRKVQMQLGFDWTSYDRQQFQGKVMSHAQVIVTYVWLSLTFILINKNVLTYLQADLVGKQTQIRDKFRQLAKAGNSRALAIQANIVSKTVHTSDGSDGEDASHESDECMD